MKKFILLTLLSVALVSGTATAAFASDTEVYQAKDKGEMT